MLQFQNISSTIANFNSVTVDIQWGGIVKVVGENGIGKTTLLKILSGLTKNFIGTIKADGFDIFENRSEFLSKTQSIFHGGLYDFLTVKENMQIWSKKWSGVDISNAALKFFNLEQYSDYKICEISMGTRRKVALSRLLICPTPLWIVDEADVYLDKNALEKLAGLFVNHTSRSGTIIFTSHGDFFDQISNQKIELF